MLYSAILRYLAKAGRYYNQSTAERLAKSIVRPADTVQSHFELILKEEMAVHKLADIMHAEIISASTKNVKSLHDDATNKIEGLERMMKAFDDPLVRIVGTLQHLQDQLKAEEQVCSLGSLASLIGNIMKWRIATSYQIQAFGCSKKPAFLAGERPARPLYCGCMESPELVRASSAQ